MGNYILAHDLGTSGNKATLFDQQGKFVKSNVHHYDTHYHGVLRAEQNPEEWWQAICASTRKILSDINPREIAAVVLSGQMQGCLCVNKKGDALHNSLIYCDQRSQAETDFLIEAVGAPKIYQITGHRPSPTYSIEKLMWIKNNHPEIFKRTSFMLQAKEYIIAKLTGEFITEQNDASGTNALDLKALNWCEEILDAAGISKNILPHIYRSTDIVGKVHSQAAGETGLLVGTPVVAGAGDGGCATIGAGSVSPGATYSYLGSSGWTSTTAEEPLDDETMRTFTWAHPIQGYFQLCGSVQTAGNCLKWFVENVLQEVQKTENIYDLVDSAVGQIKPGAEGVIFLPYLMGERTPWWNIKAKGCWIGLHQHTDWRVMARSLMEGIAMNLAYTYSIFSSSENIERTRLIGGAARTKALVQIIADNLQLPIDTLKYLEESTSLGAAMIGGVGVSLYDSFDQVLDFNPISKTVLPNRDTKELYAKLKTIFDKAYHQNSAIFDLLFAFNEQYPFD